jgi:hypothetical protein
VRLRRFCNVCGLRSFLTLCDLELYLIAFLQALVAFRSDRTVVNKDIGAIVPSDKAIAFGVVKPLNRTFQSFHVRPLGHVLFRRGRTLSFEAIVLLLAGGCQDNVSGEKPLWTRVLVLLRLTQPKHTGDGFGVTNRALHHHFYRRGKRDHANANHFIGFGLRLATTQTVS